MNQFSTNEPEVQPQDPKRDYTLTIFLLCATVLMVLSGAVGFFATSILLKLPRAESCPKAFSPLASASVRLYCAQLASEQKTVSAYVEAITMVDNLPKDHPLRAEINRNIEIWVKEILSQGETLFQSGKIDEAIKMLDQIPKEEPAGTLVKAQKEKWQSIWQEGEGKQKQVEGYITTRNWNQAYREAAQLTSLENRYWSTIRYEENLKKIQSAQEESAKLESAYGLLETGELDNILGAIAAAEEVESTSLAYQEAQELINTARNELVKFIQTKIEARDWQGLQLALDKISPEERLEENFDDWYQLAQAGAAADQDTVTGREEAIAIAAKIEARSPVYYEAQKLISRWELEVEDIAILTEARNQAQSGTREDLEKAITTVNEIPAFHPRYQEAQTEISNWNRQIQISEDQPILDRARRLAAGSTLDSWQDAMTQASLIRANRPLYPEAQKIIEQSRYNIETTQNQPILDRAVRLANQENWSDAIAKAGQIPPGRALYAQAQEKINVWQTQINAQNNLQEAYRLASSNDADDLVQAITLANKIPNYTRAAKAGQEAISKWF